MSSNNIGARVLPEGWSKAFTSFGGSLQWAFRHVDGRKQKESPEGAQPEGAVAIARALKFTCSKALTALDVSENGLPSDQEAAMKCLCSSKRIVLQL